MTVLGRRPGQRIAGKMLAAEIAYLAGLGVVFGTPFLMLEHHGRSSGSRHHVVLKVIDRPSAHSWVVESRDGIDSNWYQNIIANPYVRLYIRSQAPIQAVAHVVRDSAKPDRILRGSATLVRFEITAHF